MMALEEDFQGQLPQARNDPYYEEMVQTVQNLKCAKVFKEHTSAINCFDFCEQGNFALTAGEDDLLVIYDALQAK